MKIFISWSGQLSRSVAQALYDWLPRVIQAVKPWMSSEDIEAGARWSSELARELQSNGYGIICLTPDNLEAPWIHFEAGALSRLLESARVCPVLLGVTAAELTGPLTQFQAIELKHAPIQRFLKSLNRAMGDHQLRDDQLDEAFEVWWPKLREKLDALELADAKQPKKPLRPLPEMVAELLDHARAQERRAQEEIQKRALAEEQRRVAMERFNRDRLARRARFKLGDRVVHPKFGIGTIATAHDSRIGRVTVQFDDSGVGTKHLLLSHAGLEPVTADSHPSSSDDEPPPTAVIDAG